MNELILQMTGITKRFSGVTVLDNVGFNLKAGEVHVLIGENGAGKSTLMKILTGVYQKDEGEIFLANERGELKPVEMENPSVALKQGISMVFQEFNLLENMSIAENIYIGYEPVRNGKLDRKTMYKNAEEQLKNVSLDLSPKKIVNALTVAQKQCVEIAKCLSHSAKIIILDEPTSSLSEKEVEILFTLIRSLKKSGVSIAYISHRMEEIFEIGDRITVFRDGKMIDTVEVKDTTENQLVKMMIGREFDADDKSGDFESEDKQIMLEGKNLSVRDFGKDINFKAYAGEILGIFGLVGAGRTELAMQIFGVDSAGRGGIYKQGKKLSLHSPADAIRHKIGLVPEDRKTLGLIMQQNVRANTTLVKLRDLSWVLTSQADEIRITEEYIEKLSVTTTGHQQLIERLSGGNQQKISIAKWLTMDMDILILDEPTRGVDVGAKAEIYEIIRQLAGSGMCIILISSDLPEILRVSQRVLVMHDGEIKREDKTSNLDQESIMHAAIS